MLKLTIVRKIMLRKAALFKIYQNQKYQRVLYFLSIVDLTNTYIAQNAYNTMKHFNSIGSICWSIQYMLNGKRFIFVMNFPSKKRKLISHSYALIRKMENRKELNTINSIQIHFYQICIQLLQSATVTLFPHST